MDIPILIHMDKESVYGVTVPDLPAVRSSGATIDKAMSNVTKAIYGYVVQLVEQGKPFEIKPSPVETLSREPSYADGIWALVSFDLARLDDPPDDD